MNRDTPSVQPDPVETAAWFVAGQPGSADRLLGAHTWRANGDCAGCGVHRPTRWPCALVSIARRAEHINRERSRRPVPDTHRVPGALVGTAGTA